MQYIHKLFLDKNIENIANKLKNCEINEFNEKINGILNKLSVKQFFPFIYCSIKNVDKIDYFENKNFTQLEYLIALIYEIELSGYSVKNKNPEKYYLKDFPLVKLCKALSYDKKLLLAKRVFEKGSDFDKLLVVCGFDITTLDKQEYLGALMKNENPSICALLSIFSDDINMVNFYDKCIDKKDSVNGKRIERLIDAYYGLNELYANSYKKFKLSQKRFKDATSKNECIKEIKKISKEYFANLDLTEQRFLEGIEKYF